MTLSFRVRRRLLLLWGTAGPHLAPGPQRPAPRDRRGRAAGPGGSGDVGAAAVDWFNGLGLSENAILLGFAVVVGMGAALGVVAFYELIDAAYWLFYRWPGSFLFPSSDFLAYRPLVTATGFAAAWAIMRRFARGNDGLNVPDVQLAVARRRRPVPAPCRRSREPRRAR